MEIQGRKLKNLRENMYMRTDGNILDLILAYLNI